MSFAATTSPNTQLKVDISGTPLLVEECTSFTFAGITKAASEWDPISNVGRKRVRVGRGALGKMSGECAFDPTDPSQLRLIELWNADLGGDEATDFELAMSDNGSAPYQWDGYVESIGLSFPNNSDPVKLSFGIAPTTLPTIGTVTAVTPSSTVAACIGEGTLLGYWTGAAYATLNGVENIELTGGARDSSMLPAINQATASGHIPGTHGPLKLSFDLLFDSSETNHLAIRALLNAATGSDKKFQITCTDSGNATIALTPAYVDGWEPSPLPGANRVRVSATCDCDLTIVP